MTPGAAAAHVSPWLVVLSLLIVLAGSGGVAYRLAAQARTIRARLDALELGFASRLPGEPAYLHRARVFRRFEVNNDFEQENIVSAVAYGDEYGVGDDPLAPDDVVVDVGAHVGTFSYLCHTLGSRAVHSYEPSPANFDGLRRNLASLPGTHLRQLAVWRSDGAAADGRLVLSGPSGDNTGACSVLTGRNPPIFAHRGDAGPAAPARGVRGVALDAILRTFARVRLLKLDCEGSEFPILLTSRELGRVHRLVAEVHEVYEAEMALLAPESRVAGYAAYRVEHLATRLREAGFEVRTQATSPGLHLLDARRPPAGVAPVDATRVGESPS